jgi:hypothetical protein
MNKEKMEKAKEAYRRIRELSDLAKRNLPFNSDVHINLKRGSLFVRHLCGNYETGGKYNSHWIYRNETKVTENCLVVFDVDFGDDEKINVYSPGKWEEDYKDLFSSCEKIAGARHEYSKDQNKKRDVEQAELERKRAEETEAKKERLLENLARMLHL